MTTNESSKLAQAPTRDGNMVRILRLMAEKRASDVYLSSHAPAMMKIHGQGVQINSQRLPAEAPRALLAEIFPASILKEFDESGELNTGFAIDDVGRFRVSALRQKGLFTVVVRFIAKDIPSLESLNLPPALGDLIMARRGLILMAGSTGAGKSTTLAAMLDYRNSHAAGHILTIEDPIEFMFQNRKSIVSQREIGNDTSSLHVALRNALRQSPDVIFIGEIRDREAMSHALSFAQSGHLCVATIHANNSYHALNRILSFFPEEVRASMLGDLATSLKAIISQRLLRLEAGGLAPAIEIMQNTPLVMDYIARGDFGMVKDAIERSVTEGSQTFEEEIAKLVRAGLVDQREGMSHADSPTNLLWRLQNEDPSKPPPPPEPEPDEPSFSEFQLDVVG